MDNFFYVFSCPFVDAATGLLTGDDEARLTAVVEILELDVTAAGGGGVAVGGMSIGVATTGVSSLPTSR